MTDDALLLLAALRNAGCHCFVEEDQFFCSPPTRRIEWRDPEEAIEEHYYELRELLLAEHLTIRTPIGARNYRIYLRNLEPAVGLEPTTC